MPVALAVLLGDAEAPELAEPRLDLVVAGAALAVGAVLAAVRKGDELSLFDDASSERTLLAFTLRGTDRVFCTAGGVCTAELFCAVQLFCAVAQFCAVEDACADVALSPPCIVAFGVLALTVGALDAGADDEVASGAADDGADDGATGGAASGAGGAALLRWDGVLSMFCTPRNADLIFVAPEPLQLGPSAI